MAAEHSINLVRVMFLRVTDPRSGAGQSPSGRYLRRAVGEDGNTANSGDFRRFPEISNQFQSKIKNSSLKGAVAAHTHGRCAAQKNPGKIRGLKG
jgi:hypothetical protein